MIISETGNADDCVIDCEGDFGFWFEEGTAVIKGITMINANSGALQVWPGWVVLRVRDCVFSDCLGPGGGFNICSSGEVRITDCEFLSNVGGAVYLVCGQGFLQMWIDSCTFCGNTANYGAAIDCSMHDMIVSITNSVFCHNSAEISGGAIAFWDQGCPDIGRCTFFSNSAPGGSAIAGWCSGGCSRCIIAYGEGDCPIDVDDPWGDFSVSCSDIYGNEGGDWVGVIADDLGQDGNFSACPSFCNYEMEPYDLHLCSGSPCLPGNHPDGVSCGLIGALGQGCDCGPSGTEPTTWGAIKAMYR